MYSFWTALKINKKILTKLRKTHYFKDSVNLWIIVILLWMSTFMCQGFNTKEKHQSIICAINEFYLHGLSDFRLNNYFQKKRSNTYSHFLPVLIALIIQTKNINKNRNARTKNSTKNFKCIYWFVSVRMVALSLRSEQIWWSREEL